MDKRTQYVERLSAQMVEWDNQIERLRDKSESAPPETKKEYALTVAALISKRDEAAARLQGISTAGDNEWEELKTGTEQVLGEVKGILRDAITKIK